MTDKLINQSESKTREDTTYTQWLNTMRDAATVLELPLDEKRPAARDTGMNTSPFGVPDADDITRITAFAVLLYRYTQQNDMLFGCIRRNGQHNIIRVKADEGSTATDIQRQINDALSSDVEFPALNIIGDDLGIEKHDNTAPVIQAAMVLGDGDFDSSVPLDLMIRIDGDSGEVHTPADLFTEAHTARFAAHYLRLLDGVQSAPDAPLHELPLLSDDEIAQQLNEWNNTDFDFKLSQPVHRLFEQQAANKPDYSAVEHLGERYTYAQLNQAANRLAHYLIERGVTVEDRVGLCMQRTPEVIIAMLAILKAGAAYVPLDPAYPEDRIAYMIEDMGAPLILAREDVLNRLPATDARIVNVDALNLNEQPDTNPDVAVTLNDLAYMIYTSGSTGLPKGVLIEHRTMLNYIAHFARAFEFTAADRVLQFNSINFDPSVEEIFATLSRGATLVLRTDDMIESADIFIQRIREWEITFLDLPTAFWNELVIGMDISGLSLPDRVRYVIIGGERANPDHVATWHKLTGGNPPLVNSYGPTEATIAIIDGVIDTQRHADDSRQEVTLGLPVENVRVYLLDKQQKLVPAGVPGELYAAGDCVARGYHNRPDLTAERFLSDPFSDDPDARMYRTGDLARYNSDGTIEFMGRADDQVKIRGFRIEPGEIETVISNHASVQSSVVLVKTDPAGNLRLVAYVLPADGYDAGTLRDDLRQTLPAYMIPTTFITVGEFKLTAGGKVDKRALPEPNWDLAAAPSAAPETPLQKQVAAIWEELLGLKNIGLYDNFFELGGHSLIAARLLTRIRAELKVEVELRDFFNVPTVAAVAEHISTALDSGSTLQDAEIPRIKHDGTVQQSYAQERLWTLEQIGDQTHNNNLGVAYHLHGGLNADALHHSLQAVVERHPALRTTYDLIDDVPSQVLHHDVRLALPVDDLSHLAEAERHAALDERLVAEARQMFNLSAEIPVRARLFKLADDHHVLAVIMHHISSDGWSIDVFTRDLMAYYRHESQGTPLDLPELSATYIDYAEWHRKWLDSGRLAAQLAYWRDALADAPPALNMPTDKPYPATQSFHGQLHTFRIPDDVYAQLQQIAQEHDVTMYMVMLAAYFTLLYRYSGQDDIVLGTPHANRIHTDIEEMVGFFVSTVVVRTKLGGNPSFTDLLRRVRNAVLGAFSNQDVPFQALLDEIKPERSNTRLPIYQHMFGFEDNPMPSHQLNGLTVDVGSIFSENATFELTLTINRHDTHLEGTIEYSTDIYVPDTIERMAQHYVSLLQGIAADAAQPVHELPMLSDDEIEQQLAAWNDTARDFDLTQPVHRIIERQADLAPESRALEHLSERYTYAQLNQAANQLAHYLIAQGVSVEDRIGLCMERTPQVIISMLAILKAGAAYVPIDPAYPEERIAYMIQDMGAQLILTQTTLLKLLPQSDARTVNVDTLDLSDQPDTNPDISVQPDNLAYMIYTSGSTGNPKGVLIEHRSMVNYVSHIAHKYEFTPDDRVLQFNSITFDPSVEEIFTTLISGGTLVLRTDDMIESANTFIQRLEEWGITFVDLPTAFWSELVIGMDIGDLRMPDTVRYVIIGGERANPDHVATWHRLTGGNPPLINSYGPTETTIVVIEDVVDTAYHVANPGHEVSLGRIVSNVNIYLLDKEQKLLPRGAAGEVYAAGVCVARGYHNRPDLTAERFLPDPFSDDPDARMYRTGDLARYRPDGTLEFMGRADDQVKIRGFRVEPGEIETVISNHPTVKSAVVLTKTDPAGNLRLIAYVMPGDNFDASALHNDMRQSLPAYMIPTRFIPVEQFKLTAGGKIDKRALPEPDWDLATSSAATPETALQKQVAAVWEDLLGLKNIGVYDNFFELGGNSLLAARLLARIRRDFEVELSMREFFDEQTIAGLANLIEARVSSGSKATDLDIQRVEHDGTIRQSYAQERMWVLEQVGEGVNNNIPMAFHLHGNLNADALRNSVQAVIERHPALRTTYDLIDDVPSQILHDNVPVELPTDDLSPLTDNERAAKLQEMLADEGNRLFNLVTDIPIRLRLIKLADDHHVLSVIMHHISSDGWSVDVFTRDLMAHYRHFTQGTPLELPELNHSYIDYAEWHRQWLDSGRLEAQLAYWRETLADAPSIMNMPADKPHPPTRSYDGRTEYFNISPELTDKLKRLAQENDATLYMIMLAAYYTLLYRYSRQDDIVLGTPLANRMREELEDMIGFFVSTIPIRLDLSGNPTFAQLLQRVRSAAIGAFSNQDIPFQALIDEIKPPRNASHTPIFQHMFAFVDTLIWSTETENIAVDVQTIDIGGSTFDLTLSITNHGTELEGAFEYNTDIYLPETIQRMAQHFITLVEGITENPEQSLHDLPMLSDAEIAQQLHEWNNTARDFDLSQPVHRLFEQQVDKSPDHPALEQLDQRFTYAQLNQAANRLAHYLIDQGVTLEDRIGLCMHRSPDAIIAMMAVLKAGAAYVPIDPTYPQERIAYMIEDMGARLIVSRSNVADQLPDTSARIVFVDQITGELEQQPDSNPQVDVQPRNLVYMIYTSGSTGNPKGVLIEHRSLVNFIQHYATRYKYTPDDRALQFVSLSFDPSGQEIYSALLSGSTLVLRTDEMIESVENFLQCVRDWRLTRMVIPTAYFGEVVIAMDENGYSLPDTVNYISIGGERANPAIFARWHRLTGGEIPVINNYGPTEATITVLEGPVDTPRHAQQPGEEVALGQLVANVKAYVLDPYQQLLPAGIPGELYAAGVGVGRGYHNQQELTDERFLPDPFSDNPDARMYRTGDLVRYHADGTIEFIGRADDQVKIRGYRIEPGEVEAIVADHPDVREAVVLVKRDPAANLRLVAYIQPNRSYNVDALRKDLAETLPAFMVPTLFITVKHFKITPGGKIDKRALPEPDWNIATDSSAAPETALQKEIAAIWEDLLGLKKIGLYDNFFDLGGNSLLAARLLSHLNKITDEKITLPALFQSPTIAGIAALISGDKPADDSGISPYLLPIQHGDASRLPFFWMHSSDFTNLKPHLDPAQPFYAVLPSGLDANQEILTDVESIVDYHIAAIKSLQPEGPYLLGGYCNGGLNALAMAKKLRDEGEEVRLLVLVSVEPPDEASFTDNNRSIVERLTNSIRTGRVFEILADRIKDKVKALLLSRVTDAATQQIQRIVAAHDAAFTQLVLDKYDGKIVRFEHESTAPDKFESYNQRWAKFTAEDEVHVVPGNHESMIKPPHGAVLGQAINRTLTEINGGTDARKRSEHTQQPSGRSPYLITVKAGDTQKMPFFWAHPTDFADLAKYLPADQPFYCMMPPGTDNAERTGNDVKAIVSHYIDAMQSVQPEGPYRIGGYDSGGVVAYSIAEELRRRGETVDVLALIGTETTWLNGATYRNGRSLSLSGLFNGSSDIVASWYTRLFGSERDKLIASALKQQEKAYAGYTPSQRDLPVMLFTSDANGTAHEHLQQIELSASGESLLQPPAIEQIAKTLNQRLEDQ